MISLQFFRPFFRGPLKHLFRLATESEYRRYYFLMLRYATVPRRTNVRIRVKGWLLDVPDVASFLSAYKEIFVEGIYTFRTDSSSPVIVDCGANIGLGILFFKSNYPMSKVIAYEADPKIYQVLVNNIASNGIEGVEIHNKAVWSSVGSVCFSPDGADGGRVATGHGQSTDSICVETVDLSSIVRGHMVDFLKVDIEGAEVEVFRAGADSLDGIRNAFVEFHSFGDKEQGLGELLGVFEGRGFRVHIHPHMINRKPLSRVHQGQAMDMQLNLFFWKEHELK